MKLADQISEFTSDAKSYGLNELDIYGVSIQLIIQKIGELEEKLNNLEKINGI